MASLCRSPLVAGAAVLACAPSERWETFVSRDLIGWLQQHFSLEPRRSGRAIGGISMGGFGAMNLALHHRGEFGAVSSWSGYFNANTPQVHRPGSPGWRRDSPQLYFPKRRPPLAADHPAIDLYVGARDRFAGENRTFDALRAWTGS